MSVSVAHDGAITATLISVTPRSVPIAEDDLRELLDALGWSPADLDPQLPPRAAYAGAWHPVIAAASRGRLADLDYDMPRLGNLMRRNDWATVDLVWRESDHRLSRPQPVPARWSQGGSRDRRGGGRVRRLSEGVGDSHRAHDYHHPPGERHGPSGHDHRDYPR